MLLLNFDPAQSRITDYCKTIEKVEELVTSILNLSVCLSFQQFVVVQISLLKLAIAAMQ